MPSARNDLTLFQMMVAGSDVTPDTYADIISIRVESRLDMAAQAIVELVDNRLAHLSGTMFDIGKALKVRMTGVGSQSLADLFDGEITALEPCLDAQGSASLRIEATTRVHRLYSGAKSRTWSNSKDSDVFRTIAGEHGLSSDIESTPETFDHISQAGQTDWEFISERARRIGYLAFVSANKLYVKKPDYSAGASVELKWGENLREFRPRATAAIQPSSVEVSYWDMNGKRAQTGTNEATNAIPSVGLNGSTLANSYSREATRLVRWPAVSQTDANAVAAGARAALWSGLIQAEGVCEGTPALVAGGKVSVSNIGSKFGGDYILSQVRHVRDVDGYRTEFEVRGLRSESFSDLVAGGVAEDGFGSSRRWPGVVPGVVSDSNDPEGLGRVKVAFAWLANDYVSNWARIAVPMAGNERGVWFAPEVNDEVLVAFEHGDIGSPYVVGFLYNGQDKPPQNAVVGGTVNERVIVTTSGHQIILRDQSGNEAIEIIDKTGSNKVTIDSSSGLITVEGTDIEVKASNNIKLEGTNVEIKANANFKVEASANIDLKANAQLNAQASGPVAVKGAVINLN
ncbi:MAG: VgrG-related protein [Dehalococcoidia bacterium]